MLKLLTHLVPQESTGDLQIINLLQNCLPHDLKRMNCWRIITEIVSITKK